MIVCQACRQEVDPDDPDVVVAYEQKDATGFQAEGREYVDGLKVCFHKSCFPHGTRRYRIAD